jgi:hypothetical protein
VTWLALYPRALGDAWEQLPAPVRACHDACPRLSAEGPFVVERSRSWLARVALFAGGMPAAGEDIPLRLEVYAERDSQRWERRFGAFVMTTIQRLLPDGRMSEQRGPLELLFWVTADGGAIHYRPAGLRLCLGPLRIPLPSWLGPRVEARAWREPGDHRMSVRVVMALPLLGEVISYGGPLAPLVGGSPPEVSG